MPQDGTDGTDIRICTHHLLATHRLMLQLQYHSYGTSPLRAETV